MIIGSCVRRQPLDYQPQWTVPRVDFLGMGEESLAPSPSWDEDIAEVDLKLPVPDMLERLGSQQV